MITFEEYLEKEYPSRGKDYVIVKQPKYSLHRLPPKVSIYNNTTFLRLPIRSIRIYWENFVRKGPEKDLSQGAGGSNGRAKHGSDERDGKRSNE